MNAEHCFIKRRAKKGRFAGGPDSFKMEALIQLTFPNEISLLSPQFIAKTEKTQKFEIPSTLKKYEETAFLTGSSGLSSK